MKDIVVEKIDVVFRVDGHSIFLNDEDFTDRIRKVIIDLEAEKREDRITILVHPEWWPEFKATFK